VDLLEIRAERLKQQHAAKWHKTIERNLELAREQMAAGGGISIQEAEMSLSVGLPPIANSSSKRKR
jgi:hypothetical protein